jgi:hypothetical protein
MVLLVSSLAYCLRAHRLGVMSSVVAMTRMRRIVGRECQTTLISVYATAAYLCLRGLVADRADWFRLSDSGQLLQYRKYHRVVIGAYRSLGVWFDPRTFLAR